MPHRTKAGDAVLNLEVAEIVPGKRGDPVAWGDAMTAQRIGQFPGATRRIPIAIAMDRPFDGARDDLGARMKAVRMLQKRRKQQWLILHQSFHGGHSDAASRTSPNSSQLVPFQRCSRICVQTMLFFALV